MIERKILSNWMKRKKVKPPNMDAKYEIELLEGDYERYDIEDTRRWTGTFDLFFCMNRYDIINGQDSKVIKIGEDSENSLIDIIIG